MTKKNSSPLRSAADFVQTSGVDPSSLAQNCRPPPPYAPPVSWLWRVGHYDKKFPSGNDIHHIAHTLLGKASHMATLNLRAGQRLLVY